MLTTAQSGISQKPSGTLQLEVKARKIRALLKGCSREHWRKIMMFYNPAGRKLKSGGTAPPLPCTWQGWVTEHCKCCFRLKLASNALSVKGPPVRSCRLGTREGQKLKVENTGTRMRTDSASWGKEPMGSFARAFSLRDQRTVEMAEAQPANFLLTTRRNVLEVASWK